MVDKSLLRDEISEELKRLEGLDVLSSKSTTKFNPLRSLLGALLEVPEKHIYISTIDKAANANARMQQMQIRQEVPWKLFVGVCTKDDVKSSNTYFSQTVRNLSMPNCPNLEGTLWLSSSEGVDYGKWSPARAILLDSSQIAKQIEEVWPRLQITRVPSAKPVEAEPLEQTASIPPAYQDDLNHLDLKAISSALLDSPKQIILAGPPGTGKSYSAKLLAAALLGTPGNIDNPDITFVQFHPTYEYEDFIEGFRPTPSGEGFFELHLTPGLLMRLVNEMRESPSQRRVLIIDEMNRANLSKVLGEVLFLLEYRETEITLKSQTNLSLPSNLHIIGTMNTADRNIRSIDIALRRRFRYFDIPPSKTALERYFNLPAHANHLGEELFTGFERLNKDLAAELDRHHMIGHSFFMHSNLNSQALRDAWSYQIGPLIEEYFFDRPDLAEEYSLEKYFPTAAV